VPRLRRSRCSEPGIERRRRGRGFSYRWASGEPVDPVTVDRIRELAIPPAWTEVWICPWPNGHIQATGVDVAGRRQYRYHDEWHRHRGQEKFRRILGFAQALPSLRHQVAADLKGDAVTKERVMAATVRLLDIGCFRIGSEVYAEENETFGVATLRTDHVRVKNDQLVFDYLAKGSVRRVVAVRDAEIQELISRLKRRRSADHHLFAFKDGPRWTNISSDDVNAYIKSLAGEEYSAKDFRTWSATVLAAATLAEVGEVPATKTARRRVEAQAVAVVAEQLGNTPAVCRSSYIHPLVIDRFESGETIVSALDRSGESVDLAALDTRTVIEEAVMELLDADSNRLQAA
jgi:DNA topoisomerase-1